MNKAIHVARWFWTNPFSSAPLLHRLNYVETLSWISTYQDPPLSDPQRCRTPVGRSAHPHAAHEGVVMDFPTSEWRFRLLYLGRLTKSSRLYTSPYYSSDSGKFLVLRERTPHAVRSPLAKPYIHRTHSDSACAMRHGKFHRTSTEEHHPIELPASYRLSSR
jgi:hypothetical protein